LFCFKKNISTFATEFIYQFMTNKVSSFMKNVFQTVILAFTFVSLSANAPVNPGGSCGDNLRWSFNASTGTLSITGTGEMIDYSGEEIAPWYSYRLSITSLSLPDGLTSIHEWAFSNCSGLTSISIPCSVEFIHEGAFDGCTSLTSIGVAADNPSYLSLDGVLFDIHGNLLRCPEGKAGDYSIPNSVTDIYDGAFLNCSSLTSISVPNSGIDFYRRDFFSGCTGLTSFNVAADNLAYLSLDGVLFSKDQSSLLRYPGGKTGDYTIPNSVNYIHEWAFTNCSGLTSVNIPSSLQEISDRLFWGCSGLTSITIPASINWVGYDAFLGCSNLTSIDVATENTNLFSLDGVLFLKIPESILRCPEGKTGDYVIPNSVTDIYDGAFSNCSSLTSISIPNSISHINDRTFGGCSGLESIILLASTPPQLYEGAFIDTNPLIPVYVPCSSLDAYRADISGWSNFFNNIQCNSTGIETIEANCLPVYPNPVATELYIKHSELKAGETLQIMDASGSVVKKYNISSRDNGETLVPVSSLPQGVYLLKIGAYTGRFVKN
jgi:hypothetical protein